jgi:hypothetical protein
MEEANSFTWEEVCERWQSQPVDEDQWGEMSKEMNALSQQEMDALSRELAVSLSVGTYGRLQNINDKQTQ